MVAISLRRRLRDSPFHLSSLATYIYVCMYACGDKLKLTFKPKQPFEFYWNFRKSITVLFHYRREELESFLSFKNFQIGMGMNSKQYAQIKISKIL